MVTLSPWSASTDFGTCSYKFFLSNSTPVSLHMLKCSCAHYRVFVCTLLLPVWGIPIFYGLLSHQTVGIVCICYLSLCLIPSLRNILFVSLGLVLLLFHSVSAFVSLRKPDERVFFTNKISIYISNVLPMHHFVFPFVL
jgi:hypothetical protein